MQTATLSTAPAKTPRVRPMTPKQVQTVEDAINRADRASGRLAYATSTGKRWRDTLGTMRSALRLITPDREDLRPRLQHAIATLQAFEHVQTGGTGLDYFPTGPALAAQMWHDAQVHLARTGRLDLGQIEVLEPEAGDGALCAAPVADGALVYALERSHTLRECLRLQFAHSPRFNLLPGTDFLTDVPADTRFDVILMNPPFDKGASAAHIRKAYDHLAPGGVIEAIAGEGVFSGGDRRYAVGFDSWLANVGADVRPCPPKSFEGTTAAARRVTITR